jgi:hypothetical protein
MQKIALDAIKLGLNTFQTEMSILTSAVSLYKCLLQVPTFKGHSNLCCVFLYDNCIQWYHICCLQPGLDLEAHLAKKAKFIETKLGTPVLQPHVVVVSALGTDLACMPAYAIIGPKLYYRLDSTAHAVDIVLKSAFVFDVEYTAAARSCWTCIQNAVYGLTSGSEIISNRLQELLSIISYDN